jgi:hypothetical protein
LPPTLMPRSNATYSIFTLESRPVPRSDYPMTSCNNLASEKIHDLLGMRTVMLGGGDALN